MATDHDFRIKNGLQVENGFLLIGKQAFSSSDGYMGIKTSNMSGVNDYMMISGTGDNNTYISAKTGASVIVRAGGNTSTHQLVVSSAGASFDGNLTVAGNFTVNGTTTTLNTATLNVEDKNIVLNYGSGDTSGSANGAGITIQDAVNGSTDATILWDQSDGEFDFSHGISFPDNKIARFGTSSDLRIYHSGTESWIKDSGSGSLYIDTDGPSIQLTSGSSAKNMVQAVKDGAVNLFYNNSQKLATTSAGINITGTISSGAITASGSSVFNPTSDMVIVNEPSTNTDLQTAMRVGTAAGGLFFTTNNAIISKGAYYDGGWIATSTTGSSIDFTGNDRLTFNTFSGATVGGTAAFGARAYVDTSGLTITSALNFTNNPATIQNSEDNSGQIIIQAKNSSGTFYGVRWDMANASTGALRPSHTNNSNLGLTNRIWNTLYVNNIRIGSANTQIIDASRNLSNIGTISSGAITSTGRSTFDAVTIDDDGSGSPLLRVVGDDHSPWLFQLENASATNDGLFQAYINNSNNLYFRAKETGAYPTWYFEISNGSNNAVAMYLNSSGINSPGHVDVTSVKISGTAVIDSSRRFGANVAPNASYAINALQNGSLTRAAYFQANGGTGTGLEINATAGTYSGDALYVRQSTVSTGGNLARFSNSAGDKFIVTTAGNVGINVASPSSALDIRGAGSGGSQKNTIAFGNAGWGSPLAPNAALDGGVKLALFEGSTQKVQIGMDGNARLWLVSAGSGAQGVDIYTGSSNTTAPSLRFRVDQSGTTNIYGNLNLNSNNLQMGGTTVINSSRQAQNITLLGSTTGAKFQSNSWFYDDDNDGRLYFGLNGPTYYKSTSGHRFRANGDITRVTIDAAGAMNLVSGGDYNAPGGAALAVAGTTVIDTSRNLTNVTASGDIITSVTTTDDASWHDVVIYSSSGLRRDTAVEVHGSGYLRASYLNMTHSAGNRTTDDVFFSSNDTYIRKNTASGFRTSLDVYSKAESVALFTDTGDIDLGAGSVLTRSNHHTGHLEGSYNNIGANGAKSNPIYTIGSGYNPTDAALSNMYGIGFAKKGDATYLSGFRQSGWGMYVASDGDARVFLNAQTGVVASTAGYDVGATNVIDSSRNLTNIGTISSGAITSSGSVVASGNSNSFGNTTVGALSAGAITSSGDVKLNGDTKKFAAPVYRDTVTGISNSGYTTLFTVDGGGLASAIKMTLGGTTGSVVVNVIADISVGHYQDILITSRSGFYTTVTLKVTSNNNEDFAVEATTNSANAVNLNCEVFPLNNELVTFTTSHSFTGQSHTHACSYGVATSGTGGNDGDHTTRGRHFISDGSATAPSLVFEDDSNTGFYRVGSDKLGFVTGGAYRGMFDNLGNLLVGTTNTVPGVGNTTAGISLYNDGRIFVSKSGNTTMSLNRNTSDGNLLEFRREGNQKGSIGVNGDRIYLAGANEAVGIDDSWNAFVPLDTGGGNSDADTDLGNASSRFKNLYLSGTFYGQDISVGANGTIIRNNHHSGHLEGSYNNVGGNGSKSNPIYTIGSNYNPTDSALSNMYGIGYAHSNQASFLSGMNGGGWGLYVASDGDARIFLDAGGGVVHSTSGYKVGNTSVIDSSRNLNNIASITASGNMTITGELKSLNAGTNAIKTRFISGAANASTSDGNLYLQHAKTNDIYCFNGTSGNPRIRIYGNDSGVGRYGDLLIGTDGSFNISASDTYLILNAGTYIQSNKNHNFLGSILFAGTTVIDSNRNATFEQVTLGSGGNIILSGTSKIHLSSASGTDYLEFDDDSTSYTTATNATVLASKSDVAIRTNTNDGGGGRLTVVTGNSSPSNMLVIESNGNATFSGDLNAVNGFKINGTSVINSSRHLANVTVTSAEAEGGHSLNGNFGQFENHGTYTNFNTDVNYWGWSFVQGNTNAPHTASSQWYRNRVGLGNGYGHGLSSGDYWLEVASPRLSPANGGHMYIRQCENGSIGSWYEVGSNLRSSLNVGVVTSADINLGTTTTNARLIIKKADNNLPDHIQIFCGSTQTGEIGSQDTTWLRINQTVAKNIYTPRYIRADSGFFVDNASMGIDGSGRLRAFAGSNSSVGIGFVNDINTGFTNPSADNLGFVTGGALRANLSGAKLLLKAGLGLDLETSSGNVRGLIGAFESGPHLRIATSNNESIGFYDGGTSGTQNVDISGSGALTVRDNVTAYGSFSDIRLKENIEAIPDAIQKVQKLEGVTFNYKKDGSRSTGLIAQQLQEVLPEVVYETKDLDTQETHYAVRYGNVVGLLVEAIKEQQTQLTAQQEQINQLTTLVNTLMEK